jgi:hypothetical protein
MTRKNEDVDLTTPENVAKGQKVYDRIVAGEIPAGKVGPTLDATYGRKRKA